MNQKQSKAEILYESAEMRANTGDRAVVADGAVREHTAEKREGVLQKKDPIAVLTEIFFGAMYALWGYLLGACALPFGAYPFAIGLLCAADRRAVYVFAGACLSAVGMRDPWIRLLSYAAAIGIRILVRCTLDTPWQEKNKKEKRMGAHTVREMLPLLFSEHVNLRMTTACISAFTVGAYVLIRGGFLYYDLYGALIAIAVAPLTALIFSWFFDREKKEKANSWLFFAGFVCLACALVYATRDLNVLGVSSAAFGALFATLYVTKTKGVLKGILTGALCGLCYIPVLAPLFAFGALAGALLFPVSVTLSVLTTFAAGSAWALYVRGIGALNGVLPAILAACLLYAVVDRLFLSEKEKVKEEKESVPSVVCTAMAASELDGICLGDTASRVKTICESFSSLSDVFEAMGRSMQKPATEDLRRICDNAFESSCCGCPTREICWDEHYRTTDTEIGNLCSVLCRDGRVERTCVGDELAGRCSRLPDILDEINHNASLHSARILQCDKTEIFAMDYASIADILAETMTRDQEEYLPDSDLSEKLAEVLGAMNASLTGVIIWGKRRRHVAVRSQSLLSENALEEIARTISLTCQFSVSPGKTVRRDDGSYETVFAEREALSVSFARRTVRADGEEEYCGDTVGFFRNEEKQYAFISDGMGSGRDAAVTSGICALFLQKMLQAGNRPETTLRMLNGFLRNKGNGSLHECSATVDLMELDLISMRASFYKSGAAPTYVLRDGSLFKLRSKTLPVGILKEMDTKRIGFDVRPGDVVVMVSDGVTQGREECPWLFDLLRSNTENVGLERTADLVVQYAKSEGASDDLSVLILQIGKVA